jgi:hypothetical protein
LVDHDRPMPGARQLGGIAGSVGLDARSPVGLVGSDELGVRLGQFDDLVRHCVGQTGGEGRVVALGSNADYAESLRTELAKHGLRDRGQVLHAPLVDTAVPGRKTSRGTTFRCCPTCRRSICCSLTGRSARPLARRVTPHFLLLADRLAPGATDVLDDHPGGRPRRPSSRRGSIGPSAAGACGRCSASMARRPLLPRTSSRRLHQIRRCSVPAQRNSVWTARKA